MADSMRIAVVIPAYDMADWIGTCLSALLNQTHPYWKAVVVDDGSRDRTAAVVACFRDPRIRLIRQRNAGVSAARNAGLDAVADNGDAVLFLDADDWLAPDALERLAAALTGHPDAAAVWGRFALMGPTDGLGDPPRRVVRPHLREGDVLARLLIGNRFANGGHVLIRRDAVLHAGRFDTRLTFGEDWEYFVRLALAGPMASVPGRAPVLFVRRRAEGAYRSRVTDLGAYMPAISAIFANPDLRARLPPLRLAALNRAAQAEKIWTAGRALVADGRDGNRPEGLRLLRLAMCRRPTARRTALLLGLHLSGFKRQVAVPAEDERPSATAVADFP